MIHRGEALCPTRAPAAPGQPPWSVAETAWLQELRAARCASLELISHLQVLVAQAKFARLDACMAVAVLVLQFMVGYMDGVASGMAQRESWTAALAAAQPAAVAGGEGGEVARRRPIFVWAGPPKGVEEQYVSSCAVPQQGGADAPGGAGAGAAAGGAPAVGAAY